MKNISFLIDTNIFIPLEPTESGYVNIEDAAEFHRLVQENGCHILIHPIIDSDFENDKDEKRKSIRSTLKSKYPSLSNPPAESVLPTKIRERGPHGSHTWIDNHFLAAVYKDCVHYLVTEDKQIHKHAQYLNIQDKVLYLNDAIEFLKGQRGEVKALSTQTEVIHPRGIDIEQPFFESLRSDYPDFTKWFNTKVKPDPTRQAILIHSKEHTELAAIAILKEEDGVEFGPKGKTLKICTFKVMPEFGQQRIGELLLKAIFQVTVQHGYEYTYLTTFEKQGALISFLDNFGFGEATSRNENGELIFYKKLIPSRAEIEGFPSWEFNVKFGPYAYNYNGANSFVIPIQPEYHDILFPELAIKQSMFSDSPCGNSIRKSYLCHGNTQQVARGDMLYFYQSVHSDIRVVGIVENVLRTDNTENIVAFVGNRTVYSESDITAMCNREVLAINFRIVLLSEKSIGARRYFPVAPMTVNRIENEKALQILNALETIK